MACMFYLLQVLTCCQGVCALFQRVHFIGAHSLDMVMQEHAFHLLLPKGVSVSK